MDDAIQTRFLAFHDEHPEVYSGLVRLARRWKDNGGSKVGIEMFYSVLRWETMLGDGPDADFKLNNNFRSRYARLIMAREYDLWGLFEVRSLARA